ncbi:MAG: septation protein IspZ [Candidatus Thioglobus sp.]|nr:septation protein IspZ [Candidatus Thioglobus sp.]
MKFLLDFFPIALFFIVYKSVGLYAAIYAMIAATALQMLITRLQKGRFEKSHIITFGLLFVFGGITLIVRNPAFIMWKVSVLYVVFAVVLAGSLWIGEKPLLARMLGKELDLPNRIWQQLTWLWSVGFVGIALVNAYFVGIALSARKALFAVTELNAKVELSELDCSSLSAPQLCFSALQSEAAWVNFKLFGTLGLTFLLIIISVIFINKHKKI